MKKKEEVNLAFVHYKILIMHLLFVEACEHLKETILGFLSKAVHKEDSIKLGIRMTNGTVVNALFPPQDSAKVCIALLFFCQVIFPAGVSVCFC